MIETKLGASEEEKLVFGRLTVIREAWGWERYRAVVVQCRCGKQKIVLMKNLKSGGTKSCGCFRKERAKKGVRNEKRRRAG